MSTSGRRSIRLHGHLLPSDLTSNLEPDDLGDRWPGLCRLQPPGVWAGAAGAFAPSGDRLLAVVGGVRQVPECRCRWSRRTPRGCRCAPPGRVSLLTRRQGQNLPAGPGLKPSGPGRDTAFAIGVSATKATVQVTISNDGEAVPAQIAPRIFDPHISARIGRDNMGLGLAIVKKIIVELEGEIAYTEIGGHPSFSITLPRVG